MLISAYVSFDSQMPITKAIFKRRERNEQTFHGHCFNFTFFSLSPSSALVPHSVWFDALDVCAVAITRSKRLNERINIENVCLMLIYFRSGMTMKKKNLAIIRTLRTCVIHLNRLAQIHVFSGKKNQFLIIERKNHTAKTTLFIFIYYLRGNSEVPDFEMVSDVEWPTCICFISIQYIQYAVKISAVFIMILAILGCGTHEI